MSQPTHDELLSALRKIVGTDRYRTALIAAGNDMGLEFEYAQERFWDSIDAAQALLERTTA